MSLQALRRLEAELGDLLEVRQGGAADYARYANHPVRFLREVLRADPWPRQVEIAEAVRDHPQVTVRSCHAAGKDWAAARLALWWVYARRGLVILTGPSATQVEEILTRRELRRAFASADFSGTLGVRALRPDGLGEAGILTRTGNTVQGMQGFHDAKVLFIVTEAQDPDISHAWDAAFACATGEHDRILTLGNPTEPDGRFYQAHRPGSGWHTIKIAAADIPNVREGRTVIPGLFTREGVERFRQEYGEESPTYISRVLAEFPAEAVDSLVRGDWIDRAVEAWRTGALEAEAADSPITLGIDPARLGPDRTAICVRQGPIIRRFETWQGLDTMETHDRIRALVRKLIYEERQAVDRLVVDEVGLGGGVLDRLRETLPLETWHEVTNARGVLPSLRERRPEAEGFDAASRAGNRDRFRNKRAAAYWHLRKLLEEGRIALPPNPELAEELTRTRVRFGADGRTEIEAKRALKERLGRSPDLGDSLMIALSPMVPDETMPEFMWA